MVGVFVAFIRVVYGRMIYMSLPVIIRIFTVLVIEGSLYIFLYLLHNIKLTIKIKYCICILLSSYYRRIT